jgi:hypothetical protein
MEAACKKYSCFLDRPIMTVAKCRTYIYIHGFWQNERIEQRLPVSFAGNPPEVGVIFQNNRRFFNFRISLFFNVTFSDPLIWIPKTRWRKSRCLLDRSAIPLGFVKQLSTLLAPRSIRNMFGKSKPPFQTHQGLPQSLNRLKGQPLL